MKKLLTAVILFLVTSFLFSAELKLFYPGATKAYIDTKFEDTCELYEIKPNLYQYSPWGSLTLYGYNLFKITVKYDAENKVEHIQIAVELEDHESFDKVILGILLDEEITVQERLTRDIIGKSKKGYKYTLSMTDSLLIIMIDK